MITSFGRGRAGAVLEGGAACEGPRKRGPYLLVLMLGLGMSAQAAVDWMAFSSAEFAVRAEPQRRIEAERFDEALMRAAIFHATNRVRREHGLPVFTHLPQLDVAADLKAAAGVLQPELRHENPLPVTALPADRVEASGLKYRRVAENLARLTIYDVPAGSTEIGVRQHGGTTEFFDPKTKQPVREATYAGFAASVVAAWMKSPGHRANILNRELTSLGVAARFCFSPIGHQPQVYAVQVFFTPR